MRIKNHHVFVILLFTLIQAFAENPVRVFGQVVNTKNEPLQGVIAKLVNLGLSDTTDYSGYFSITIASVEASPAPFKNAIKTRTSSKIFDLSGRLNELTMHHPIPRVNTIQINGKKFAARLLVNDKTRTAAENSKTVKNTESEAGAIHDWVLLSKQNYIPEMREIWTTMDTRNVGTVKLCLAGITILSPNGGEEFRIGDTMTVVAEADSINTPYPIVWISVNAGKQWYQLSYPEQFNPWAKNSWKWLIPDSLGRHGITPVVSSASSACMIEVCEYATSFGDRSDSTFTIKPR